MQKNLGFKKAFTYLELIISMSIVVVVVTISTPLLVAMSKTNVNPYGEFICYARAVVNEKGEPEWKLFQNERFNVASFSVDDLDVTENGCVFDKPSGNINSYTVTVIGGGGSGSAPYFFDAHNNQIQLAPGAEGGQGEEKTAADNLSLAFAGDSLNIKFCDDSNENPTACIGKGGESVTDYNTAYVIAAQAEDVINKIKNGEKITEPEAGFVEENPVILGSSSSIEDLCNTKSAEEQIAVFKEYEKPENCACYNSGISGKATKIKLSGGDYLIAKGGKYGLSDPEVNNKTYSGTGANKFSTINKNGKYIYIGGDDDFTPDIDSKKRCTNCSGADANKDPRNYGQPGGAGIFICRIVNVDFLDGVGSNLKPYCQPEESFCKNPESDPSYDGQNNENKLDEQGKCYSAPGGMGAGGAIRIQWN